MSRARRAGTRPKAVIIGARLKRSFSVHSSDTEEYVTPKKRLRKDISSPCASDSTPSSCRVIRVAARNPSVCADDFDLSTALRRCCTRIDASIVGELKDLPHGKGLVPCVQRLLHTIKLNVKKRFCAKDRIIETELYLSWLQELGFVVTGIENLLNAKIPGTRQRLKGLGHITFGILYHIIDGFISDVDHHHDGRLSRGAEEHPIYPVTMSLVEEAKDSSTDSRAEKAVRLAEEALAKYDRVMEVALRRLKAESRKTLKSARTIAHKERALARACCLLCEQTGFCEDKGGTGDSILQSTRRLMRQWKAEHGITDADEYDSPDDS
ncbi:hypothetical protein NP233_g1747 [Leucocoprinus birnbaumii]|uniref:Uncharacterized protein n=1 Tax=Leucocoprinus birnbaumii TaxID=56174 RepID=A0AAD5W213_9AGAR|nr:hypothetical protein NP233_g1747 [Leucocoprinus birnbaumii]